MNVIRLLPALLLGMFLSASPVCIYAARQEKVPKPHSSTLSTHAAVELFSPRVRRSTITYLRLRLLELREQDLDRARAAIERRLSVDELLTGAAGPQSGATPTPRRKSTP